MMRRLCHPEKRSMQFLYLTLSGMLSGICMAFPSLLGTFAEWIVFIPAALALYAAADRGCSLKRAYLGGFWLIYSQHIIVYHWFISFYPLDFTGMSRPAALGVVLIAIFGLSLLAAMFGGVFGLMAVGIAKLDISKKFPAIVPLAASACYVLNEWIRTQFWFGVPWGRLALGQLTDGVPITVLSASVFGSYFVSFLIVIVSFLLAQALYLNKFKLRSAIACSLIVANLAFGIIAANVPERSKNTIKVAAVQANINSRDKWAGMTAGEIYEAHIELAIAAAEEGAKLIVMPETAIMSDSYIPRAAAVCEQYGVAMVFGAFSYDENNDASNVLYYIDPCGELSETVYAKRHLVPFGEYVPMRDIIMFLFPPLGEIAMLESDLIPGNESNIFKAEIAGSSIGIGGLICFDSIYEELSYASSADGADILCIGTNDSWFEDSRAVFMHCEQSRLRAIETGLPVVRAANTGVSAIITSKGEVLEELEPLVTGYIISEISMGEDRVDSYIMNEIFLWLCIFFIGAVPCVQIYKTLIRKRKNK